MAKFGFEGQVKMIGNARGRIGLRLMKVIKFFLPGPWCRVMHDLCGPNVVAAGTKPH